MGNYPLVAIKIKQYGELKMKIEVILTGTRYYNGFPCLDLGGEVRIEADEENAYSNNAFSISTLGGLRIGSVAENPRYIPRKMTSDITKLSPELKQLVNDGYTINKAVVKEIVRKMAVIEVELNEPVVSEEMEEPEMSIEVIGQKDGLFTLVGVQYYVNEVEIGTEVELRIVNNTTFAYTAEEEPLGVFPQKDAKCDAVINLGCPLTRNSEIKNDGVAFEREYIVVGFITETKGNKVSKYAVLQLKSVVEATDDNQEELDMENVIAYGFAKMGELITLYDVENIVEPVIEPVTEAEALCSVEAALEALNEEIRALMKEEEAIKAKKEALMAKREELASINAKRIKLIDAIIPKLENLELPVLEAIQAIISSSAPEEDIPSSFEEKTNNNGVKMEEKYEYSIIFEKGDEEVVELANEVNDVLIQMVDDAPLKGEPTMFDISNIDENTVYARLDFNMADLETPNLEKKVCDAIRTILMEKHVIFSMDTMPNVDAEDGYYYYPIEIKQ